MVTKAVNVATCLGCRPAVANEGRMYTAGAQHAKMEILVKIKAAAHSPRGGNFWEGGDMGKVERRRFLGLSATILGGGLMAGNMGHGFENGGESTAGSVQHHVHAASLMTETAGRFLAALSPEQRAKATFQFSDDERLNWHFIPKVRQGLTLGEMTPYQRHLANALLAAGLSQRGYIKAVTIMSLEDVLKTLENDRGDVRNPEKYHFTVFGTPSDTGTWGWRVEGHHLSQNYTVANGQVVDGPSFFGANPAEVRLGPRRGLRALAGEDDLGFEVIQALDEAQQKIAIVDSKAYSDILTLGQPEGGAPGAALGASGGEDERQAVRRAARAGGTVRLQCAG